MSTGMEATVVINPLIILATKGRKIPSSKYLVAKRFCLACEYEASCAALTTTARPMVGTHPLHRVKRPSSLVILARALKALVYPLLSASGKRPSAVIRMSATSAGVPTNAPHAPAVIPSAALVKKFGGVPSGEAHLSKRILKTPKRVVV